LARFGEHRLTEDNDPQSYETVALLNSDADRKNDNTVSSVG
jgi:hypothetical protein